jgi:hypothetical protein
VEDIFGPGLQVGEDSMDPGQDDVDRHGELRTSVLSESNHLTQPGHPTSCAARAMYISITSCTYSKIKSMQKNDRKIFACGLSFRLVYFLEDFITLLEDFITQCRFFGESTELTIVLQRNAGGSHIRLSWSAFL